MSKENKRDIFLCICAVLVLIIVPLALAKGADFGGSDDAGAEAVSEVQGYDYEPWFTPIMERFLGGEIPGEIESLLFCLQTGIGVGVIAYFMGKWTERYRLTSTKKGREEYQKLLEENAQERPKKDKRLRMDQE